jgi:hypothetical protein
MGAWGYGIRQDDVVCDVIGAFEDNLKQGKNIVEASKAVRKQFAEAIKDRDDGPLAWIGLADAQWTYGQLDPGVLQHVKDDFDSGRSLSPWEESESDLSRRKATLKQFIEKLASPNPKPKKTPRITVRLPKFQPGDCLSILLSNGQFGAAIVLAVDSSNAEYGMDMVGVLDYMSPDKPKKGVFQERNWLHRTHHNWNNRIDLAWYMHVGFRKMKPRIEVVCRIDLLEADPKNRMEGIAYASWEHLGEQIVLQREWDSNK